MAIALTQHNRVTRLSFPRRRESTSPVSSLHLKYADNINIAFQHKHDTEAWIPACAGMTSGDARMLIHHDSHNNL